MSSLTLDCPACTAQILPGSRFCSSCGQTIDAVSQVPTIATGRESVSLPRATRLISSDSIPVGGFAPGSILADRYRIVGLLGRGGMGEVYRADDLKLGQAVALKFLPRSLSDDPVRRERFFAEVRIARQLSHPNVCRVYDIAEYENQHFLSMEYIDGEDLASLLQRIGYLSNEKALDITRQLTAGLSAAHARGILHRDLKPSNVMLDGFGGVRITDFGLAVAADDDAQASEVSGTPAYMAPEQLAGKGSTVRSDIYSLALILYEVYTGKRAFKGASIAELREQKETRMPTAPSDLRPGVDPVVERLIMRCLERDPGVRPGSLAQMASALPGGDALSAAIAAGQTPSPDLLIAAGSRAGLRPVPALALLAVAIVGTALTVVWSDPYGLAQYARLTRPPDALIERARDVIAKAGYAAAPLDSASAFFFDADAKQYMMRQDPRMTRPADFVAAGVVGFLYRESPRPLLGIGPLGSIDPGNPVMQYPGEVAVQMDGQGRLRSFQAVPPRVDSAGPRAGPDWSPLFAAAQLDPSLLMPVEPQWTPPSYADVRAAWRGALPDAPAVPVRIEAAAYHGRPVSFIIVGPWTPSTRELGFAAGVAPVDTQTTYTGVLIVLLVTGTAGIVVARRNLRIGRGDRRGATRLMLMVFALWLLSWIGIEHHVADLSEAQLVAALVGFFLPVCALLWVFYIAVEPLVRRRWPAVMVSWSRLMSGDWRDPLVGRDVLIGVATGVVAACLFTAPPMRGAATQMIDWNMLSGTRSFLGALLGQAASSVFSSVSLLLLLVLVRVLLRRDWAMFLVAVTILAPSGMPLGDVGFATFMSFVAVTVAVAINTVLLLRVGLVARTVAILTTSLYVTAPLTTHGSAWYAWTGYVVLAIVGALALYGFRISLGNQLWLGGATLED